MGILAKEILEYTVGKVQLEINVLACKKRGAVKTAPKEERKIYIECSVLYIDAKLIVGRRTITIKN
ncbi:hypothetical protein B5F13_09155 [Drancourtella sp. An177]|nr:hypothetical protein B5F13_09155 [Drancourtella sp. An177]